MKKINLNRLKKKKVQIVAGALVLGMAAGSFAALATGVFSSNGNSGNALAENVTVTLGDYMGIPVEVPDTEVTDEDINNYAAQAVNLYNINQISEKTVVEDGDTVSVLMNISADGNSEGITDALYITVGDGTSPVEVEQGLIGADVGEELTIPMTFPDPYEPNEALSGLTAVCKVTVQYILEGEILDVEWLTDKQAQDILDADVLDMGTTDVLYTGMTDVLYMGVTDKYSGVSGFYEYARDYAVKQAEETRKSAIDDAIRKYLLDTCRVEPFPEKELERRTEAQMASVEEICSTYYGMTAAEYWETVGTTEEEYRASFKDGLKDTIKLEHILIAIADREGIAADGDGYLSYMDENIKEMGYDSLDDFYAVYDEEYAKKMYRINKVVDFLIENADITYMEGDDEDV